MYYTLTENKPFQKTVKVTVAAEEVNAVMDGLERRYKANAKVPAFRQGTVPVEFIRKQFKEEIVKEARATIADRQVTVILADIKLTPVSQVDLDAGSAPVRDREYTYSFSFFYLPDFTLAEYEGRSIRQQTAPVLEKEIDAVVERLRHGFLREHSVTAIRKPVDGDVALIDFAILEEDGSPCAEMSGTDTQVVLGNGGALQVFEDVLKNTLLGEELTETVTFPDSFRHQALAGTRKRLRIKLKALAERVLPQLDDDFAASVNPTFTTVKALRRAVEEDLALRKENLFREQALDMLLETLLAERDIPLPEGMIDRYQEYIIADVKEDMARQGKNFADLARTEQDLKDDARREAERLCKKQLYLLRLAEKEGLVVTDREINSYIRQEAVKSGLPYPQVLGAYSANGHILALRDRLIADKARDLLYKKSLRTFEQASHFTAV